MPARRAAGAAMTAALDIEIRRMRPADATRVTELLTVAFTEEFEGTGADPAVIARQLRAGSLAQLPPLRWIAPVLGVEFAFFVAMLDGRVIGCAGLMGQRLPVVNSVAVHPEFRRHGVGVALVRAAEAYAAAHGHDRVVLDVLAHNDGARALYLALGYEEYHRYRAYVRTADVARPAAIADVTWARGYQIEAPGEKAAAAFDEIERLSLPPRLRAVSPSLRSRYTATPPSMLERLLAGERSYRRVLTHNGDIAGFIVAHGGGAREGRIEYPLIPSNHTGALPAVITDAVAFLMRAGASSVRIDLSEDRPDQHAAVEQLGFSAKWTFVQMAHQLEHGVRIPVRRHDAAPGTEQG